MLKRETLIPEGPVVRIRGNEIYLSELEKAKASLPRWNEKYTSRVAVFHQFWRLDTGTEYTVPTVDQLVHEATLLSWLQITIVLTIGRLQRVIPGTGAEFNGCTVLDGAGFSIEHLSEIPLCLS
ncbi:predicted protein [Histoplasma capsulatum var. duboisii H88]|uniref:Predicted protein n=1 Tax=Ajellomyces capsulatus (strain H88) TaxID=544711 RepID=F0URV6_AJEC8|nr:predicted protein [Histoplasma capsulatum var. duboisii H88]